MKKTYNNVHYLIRKTYGKADHCEFCNIKGAKKYEWALLKGKDIEFKRENFIQLCKSCHSKYDNAQTNFKNSRKNISEEHRKRLKEAALKDWAKRKNLIN